MDKPDKFAVEFEDTGPSGQNAWVRVSEENLEQLRGDYFFGTYLLATPERELASELVEALTLALQVIADAVEYQHSGDPWEENAFDMQELGIHEYSRDGRMEAARAVLAKLEGKG